MAMTRRMTMNCRRSTGVLGALTALLVAAAGLPPRAGAFCNGSFFITQHGFCSISTTQACGIPSLGDAECPAGETCVNDPRVVSFINPCSPSANPPCNAATAQARIKLDVGAGPISASPFKLTVNRLRFDLDCVGSPSLPCTDQGDIVRYLGDTTITSNCTTAAGNVTWVSTTAQGGNEIVFNPTDGSGNPRPLVINQNTVPGDNTGGGCSVFFNIQVVSQEPASGPLSDNTPAEIEQIAGYTTTSNDATCAVNQPSGSQQTNNVPICPSCAVDECNQGCDQTTGTCTPKGDSTPCTDTDNDLCTTAGCEVNAAGVGACVQTHKRKTHGTADECHLGCVPATGLCTAKDDSTPCSDTDGNLCTTAGCEKNAAGVGVCLQTHKQKTDCTVNECNLGCVPATGLCTAKDDSTPCSDSDGNLCTTAGCEKNAAGVGVCVQTHKQKTDCTVDECNLGCVPATGLCTAKDDSTPCRDSDGNLCTTAGCEKNAAGVGVCLQTHTQKTDCTVNECNLGCVPATGLCTAKDDSTPCTDSDGNLCTTAGCEKNAAGVGVCLQTHKQKTDCTVNECNLGCVPATGLCTAKDDSTPCS